MGFGLEQTWRWYGPDDPVTLKEIKMTGATGIVTALHHVPNGEVWSIDNIRKRKSVIENAGLRWSVVESLPVHESIKSHSGDYCKYIANYKQSLVNLAKCGIKVVCYNFMPVLDWTRTNLSYTLENGSEALYFEIDALVAFDLFILKRPNAEICYSTKQISRASEYFKRLSPHAIQKLAKTIIAGLPGSAESYLDPNKRYDLEKFQGILDTYVYIGANELRANLIHFLKEIIPVAEEHGILMSIHPDDPPFTILGLSRVVGTLRDFDYLFKEVPSINNGITFCTGSLAARHDNDLGAIFQNFSERVHFVHLRNIKRNGDGDFYESGHLQGDVDMFDIVGRILDELYRRKLEGREDYQIPMRPDHGHRMMDDLKKQTNPGYSAIGRLKGLAELRGLILGIEKSWK
ncbi:mannonate dehydratase [Muricauda sp. ANG21]|uniref:mannonate dehydratase n=1 Tax=Allomuricauda sp. ANG21 TaxID=3042468 RepID=UPI003456859A